MRLKISFEDIKKLFNYIDKKGQGEIGYEEFTLLLEERWRGIDPVMHFKAGLANRGPNPMIRENRPELNVYTDCTTEQEMLEKLEGLAQNRIKVPIKHPHQVTTKIGRLDATEQLKESQLMPQIGQSSTTHNKMADIMNHSYLTKSSEQRVQR